MHDFFLNKASDTPTHSTENVVEHRAPHSSSGSADVQRYNNTVPTTWLVFSETLTTHLGLVWGKGARQSSSIRHVQSGNRTLDICKFWSRQSHLGAATVRLNLSARNKISLHAWGEKGIKMHRSV